MNRSRYSVLFPPFILLSLCLNPTWGQAQSCCPDGNSIISTFAGTGVSGNAGDGGPASAAQMGWVVGLYRDTAGNILISDNSFGVIRKVSPSGVITTIAGTGTGGFSGDGGPATMAQLSDPCQMTEDAAGNLYVCDYANNRIRKIDTAGIITTIAGNGTPGHTGDGGPATAAELYFPFGITMDPAGNIYCAGFQENAIRKIDPSGIITTIAGNGTAGHTGDGGPATAALIRDPEVLIQDPSGNIYFHEDSSNYIRKIDTAGIITTIAGNGGSGSSGDGGPATLGAVGDIHGMAFCGGTLYMADFTFNNIRTINACGILGTITGSGSGNGVPVSSASVMGPYDLLADPSGNLLVAESSGNRVRIIAPDCSPTPTLNCTLPPTNTPSSTATISPTSTPTSTPTISPTSSSSNTPTNSPTPTPTSSPTLTPSMTNTFTPTPTFTPTCEIHVWPNPYNPQYAVNGTLKVSCLPAGSTVSFYTLSGELAAQRPEAGGMVQWEGNNLKGLPVSAGIYYYVIQIGNNVLGRGKFLVIH